MWLSKKVQFVFAHSFYVTYSINSENVLLRLILIVIVMAARYACTCQYTGHFFLYKLLQLEDTLKGWFTLTTEATEAESQAESESEESSDLV